MSQFNTNQVTTLFHMALARADAERNRSGFRKLSEELKRHVKADSSVASLKYLDERIHQQLLNAGQNNEPTIGLYRNNLDDLSIFNGFKDFLDFENNFNSIKSIVDQSISLETLHDPNKFLMIYDEEESDYIEVKCKQSVFAKQTLHWQFSPLSVDHGLEENIDRQLTGQQITIVFIAEKMNCDQLILKNQHSSNCFFVILEDATVDQIPLEVRSRLLAETQFDLLIQLIFSLLIPEAVPQRQVQETPPEKQSTHIHNSGTVVQGNIGEIKAEYISSRDMHININNPSKK